MLSIVVYSSVVLKMSNHPWSHSTLNYLLMKYSSCRTFGSRVRLPTEIEKKQHTHGRHYADLAVRQTTSMTCENAQEINFHFS